MSAKSCPFFDACAAPLCPLDEQSLSNGIWYPDEAICKNKEFSQLIWIKNQRALAKRSKHMIVYYTFKILSKSKTNIKGIDPEREVR